jgi:hypothetical protein
MRRAGRAPRPSCKLVPETGKRTFADIDPQVQIWIDSAKIAPFKLNPHSPDNALSFGVTCAIQI